MRAFISRNENIYFPAPSAAPMGGVWRWWCLTSGALSVCGWHQHHDVLARRTPHRARSRNRINSARLSGLPPTWFVRRGRRTAAAACGCLGGRGCLGGQTADRPARLPR